MSMERLFESVQQKGPVCVGLDTQLSFLPDYLKKKVGTDGEKIFEFNRAIIDATEDEAGCFKLQIACYEALGLDGMRAFSRTLQYARSRGNVTITDAKRGDISSTATQYARAHFSGDFETDLMTINVFMGEDAVSPYYSYLEQNKGVFALVKTSNPSGKDFQDLLVDGETLYERTAKKVSEWGERFIGKSGFSAIGAVTGLTYPEEFERIRPLLPHTFLLIPGYGAQGGTGKDIAGFFKDGVRGVVNSSRGLITAHKGKCEDEHFTDSVRAAVLDMKKDILQWL
ncbi:MAG: orotidine-5'-phosphate decarboxylase [Clostridiales bacterium]|nr:orotidine-5'-phosphate decarboxylase [Clostridiales bacterium]